MNVEIWTVIGLLIANAGFLYGMWKHLITQMEEYAREQSQKLSRVYERLDVHKKYIDDKFVLKDMCKVLHEQGTLNTVGLETRITLRMDKLESKFDQIIELLTKK